MMIGALAEAAGVSSQTVRFYERAGLLPEPERGANGYRLYTPPILGRLRFINQAQAAGLSLTEIRSIVDLRDTGHAPCAHVSALLEAKLANVRERIDRLITLQTELDGLLDRSRHLDPADCTHGDICHILTTGDQRSRTVRVGA